MKTEKKQTKQAQTETKPEELKQAAPKKQAKKSKRPLSDEPLKPQGQSSGQMVSKKPKRRKKAKAARHEQPQSFSNEAVQQPLQNAENAESTSRKSMRENVTNLINSACDFIFSFFDEHPILAVLITTLLLIGTTRVVGSFFIYAILFFSIISLTRIVYRITRSNKV